MSTVSDVFVAGLEQVRKSWMKHLSRLLMLAFALSVTIGSAFAQPCGPLSDQLLIGNVGPNNSLEVHAFSDESLLPMVDGTVEFEGVTYFNSGLEGVPCEDFQTGITFTFPPLTGTSIKITFGSDGLVPMNFLGFPDVSDGMQFNGGTPGAPTNWEQVGPDTWVIPANASSSPIGDFDFPDITLPGVQFANFVPIYDPIPEPSSLLLLASGLTGLAAVGRRRLLN